MRSSLVVPHVFLRGNSLLEISALRYLSTRVQSPKPLSRYRESPSGLVLPLCFLPTSYFSYLFFFPSPNVRRRGSEETGGLDDVSPTATVNGYLFIIFFFHYYCGSYFFTPWKERGIDGNDTANAGIFYFFLLLDNRRDAIVRAFAGENGLMVSHVSYTNGPGERVRRPLRCRGGGGGGKEKEKISVSLELVVSLRCDEVPGRERT